MEPKTENKKRNWTKNKNQHNSEEMAHVIVHGVDPKAEKKSTMEDICNSCAIWL